MGSMRYLNDLGTRPDDGNRHYIDPVQSDHGITSYLLIYTKNLGRFGDKHGQVYNIQGAALWPNTQLKGPIH